MGQNFAGWIRIGVEGNKNCVMKVRFAEDLQPDSTLDVTSNENANASVKYILKGNKVEIYEPRFTFFGFRYVEISSLNGPLDIISVEGRTLYSDNQPSGQFECGNMLVNKIHKATVWSQKSNMLGYPTDCPQRDERLGWLGDWGSMVEGWKEGEPASVPTAFYFQNAKIMSYIANVLEMQDDKEYFGKLASAVRDKFNSTYLDNLTANYNDGSQMANSFPLYLGIVPENIRPRVVDNLVNDIVAGHNYHLTTGVLGTKYMPEALAMEGREDIAWKIINQKSSPCWYDMVNRYTTMCEFWTLKQSKNHVMMGSIDAWFYKYLAGIRPDESAPAFSSFRIKPVILDSLYYAGATIETIRGTISSHWTIEGDKFALNVEVPFNTTAFIYLPGKLDDEVKESGRPLSKSVGVEYIGYNENYHKMKVGSGRYLFTINN